MRDFKELKQQAPQVQLEVSGKRGVSYFRFRGITPDQRFTHFEDKPAFHEVDVLARRYLEDFQTSTLDRLDVAYTKFESASRQFAVIETLLPIAQLEGATEEEARLAKRSTNSCLRPKAFWTRSCPPVSRRNCSSVFWTPR